ncbi:MFS transporter [Rhodobacter capsulatus]
MALVRDMYSGREMAKVTAFIMMVFILVPALAPSAGQLIIGFAGWRGVFYAFILFALIGLAWLSLRQPETPRTAAPAAAAALGGDKEVLGDRDVRLYILTMTLGFDRCSRCFPRHNNCLRPSVQLRAFRNGLP